MSDQEQLTPPVAAPPAPPASEPVIEARNLARWYGDVAGLTDVTVRIPSGVIGLLGPNGAGKSTLMRLLTGQIYPSQGVIRVLGRDPARDPELYRDVGFCSEDDALFDSWSALDVVAFRSERDSLIHFVETSTFAIKSVTKKKWVSLS